MSAAVEGASRAATGRPTSPSDVAALARARSRDPLPDLPTHEGPQQQWFAPEGQWELGLLHRLVREGFAAARDVGFATNFGALESTVHFRPVAGQDRPLSLRATGTVEFSTPGPAVQVDADGVTHVDDAGDGWVVTVTTDGSAPAGLAVVAGAGTSEWECSLDGTSWEPAAVGLGTASTPPHEQRNPIHRLPMTPDGDLWSLPADVLGRVVLRCDGVPRIVAGESREEARAGHGEEQHHDVVQRPDGTWASVHELGLRHLAVHGAVVEHVDVEARTYPMPRRGAFACSDERLTDIWDVSAYTLRACSHGLVLDGIKRDRMPWMGDLALGAPASAYTAGDAELVRRGLVALGRPTSGYVNGIVDYSLWWLICTADFARYFDAGNHHRRDAARIDAFVERLAAEAGPDGVLRPRPGADAYAKPVFIDWGVDVDPDRDSTALQMLWYWALRSASAVLADVGHPGAPRWSELAERLRTTLRQRAWDAEGDAWTDYLDDRVAASTYPNLFAVASGIMGDDVPAGVAQLLRDGPRTRTPFVTAFALSSLAQAGFGGDAVDRIRSLWGDMLDHDATTFWEEFAEDGAGLLEMYGRPFGKSLCHAWAAGPARLLPEIVCGLRPLGPGWRTFAVEPALHGLEWAGAVVPTAHGDIGVVATAGSTRVDVPAGLALVHGSVEYPGPQTVVLRTGARARGSGGRGTGSSGHTPASPGVVLE